MAGWVTAASAAQSDPNPPSGSTKPQAATSGAAASGAAAAMTEGPILLERACTVCHSADTVLAERKTAAGWRYTIDSMVGRGADLTDAEANTLHAYLTATRGS